LQDDDLDVPASVEPLTRHLLLRWQKARKATGIQVPALARLALRDGVDQLAVVRSRAVEHSPARRLLDAAGNGGADGCRGLSREIRQVDRRGHLDASLDAIHLPGAAGQVDARSHLR